MPTEMGWRHITFTVNGERVTGFANEDPPVEFPDIDLIERTRGPDGTAHDLSTGTKGGEVMVKLLPTSRFVGVVLRWMARILNDEILDFEGSYADSRLGISSLLRGGKLIKCPPAVVPGETFECTFDFEEIVPQADRHQVDPPPGNLA